MEILGASLGAMLGHQFEWISKVMTPQPKLAHAEELASAVEYRMEQVGIMAMPVLDSEQHLTGVIHLHDLMRAGVA